MRRADFSLYVYDNNGMCCTAGAGSYSLTLIQPDGTSDLIATGWGNSGSPRVPRGWKQLTPRLVSTLETKT